MVVVVMLVSGYIVYVFKNVKYCLWDFLILKVIVEILKNKNKKVSVLLYFLYYCRVN